MRRRLGMVDLDTGELLQGVSVAVPKPRRKHRERFMLLFQDTLCELAQDRKLRGESYRVLMVLLAELDYDNFLSISQREIGERLQMHQQSVARALQQLLERGVVIAGPKVHGQRTYRLGDKLGWKGSAVSLDEHRRRRLKPAPDVPHVD